MSNSHLLPEALTVNTVNQELSGSTCHNTNVQTETEEADLHPLVTRTSWNMSSYKLLNDWEHFSPNQDLYCSIIGLGQIKKK